MASRRSRDSMDLVLCHAPVAERVSHGYSGRYGMRSGAGWGRLEDLLPYYPLGTVRQYELQVN